MSDIVTSYLCLRNLTSIYLQPSSSWTLKLQVDHTQKQILIAISGLGHLGTDGGDGDTIMSYQKPIDRGQPKQWCSLGR